MASFCTVYGRFAPSNTYAFDEIPMPFAFDQTTTLDIKEVKTVHIRTSGNGLDKRQCTVALTLRAALNQNVSPSIIFRGKGLRIYQNETEQYPDGLNIIWQEKAWMDELSMISVSRHFDDCREDDGCDQEEAHLVLDNDSSHETDIVKECARRACNALLTYTPPICTDAVSVVDRVAHIFKYDVKCEYEKWVEENFDEWENNPTTAATRRILLSIWIWNAWLRMKRRSEFIEKMFVECGIILRKDGSDKQNIHIPGYEDYVVDY